VLLGVVSDREELSESYLECLCLCEELSGVLLGVVSDREELVGVTHRRWWSLF